MGSAPQYVRAMARPRRASAIVARRTTGTPPASDVIEREAAASRDITRGIFASSTSLADSRPSGPSFRTPPRARRSPPPRRARDDRGKPQLPFLYAANESPRRARGAGCTGTSWDRAARAEGIFAERPSPRRSTSLRPIALAAEAAAEAERHRQDRGVQAEVLEKVEAESDAIRARAVAMVARGARRCRRARCAHTSRQAPRRAGDGDDRRRVAPDDIMRLHQPVHIVVATPGRLVDLASKNVAKLNQATMLVMDEADKLLSPEFQPVISQLIDFVHQSNRQILLYRRDVPGDGEGVQGQVPAQAVAST